MTISRASTRRQLLLPTSTFGANFVPTFFFLLAIMANYQYDEGGSMAGYFIITFLALILVPVTLTMSPSYGSSYSIQ